MSSSSANHDAPNDSANYSLGLNTSGLKSSGDVGEALDVRESVDVEETLDQNDTVEFEETAESVAEEQVDEVDETVADYISDLLKRISGDSNEDSAPVQYQVAPDPASDASQSASTVDSSDKAETAPVERRRREPSVAAESLHDMSALRALANESARNAIGTHDQKQRSKSAITGLLLAAGIIVSTLVLGQLSVVPLASKLFGSLVGLVVGLYLCVRYHQVTAKLADSDETELGGPDEKAGSAAKSPAMGN